MYATYLNVHMLTRLRQTVQAFEESNKIYAIPAETASQGQPFQKENLPGPGKCRSFTHVSSSNRGSIFLAAISREGCLRFDGVCYCCMSAIEALLWQSECANGVNRYFHNRGLAHANGPTRRPATLRTRA